jgi:hypothetical protein
MGDRLVLDVTNSTSVALGSITFVMGNGAGILDQAGYLIYPGVYSSPNFYTALSDGVVGTQSSVTYDFQTPLAVGASLGFYIPITLPTASTTFTITESVGAVPEPGSLMLMVSGLAGLGALGWIRRRKARTAAV